MLSFHVLISSVLPRRQYPSSDVLDLQVLQSFTFFPWVSMSLRYSGFIEDISIEVGHSTVPYVLNLERRGISVTVSICMYVEIIFAFDFKLYCTIFRQNAWSYFNFFVFAEILFVSVCGLFWRKFEIVLSRMYILWCLCGIFYIYLLGPFGIQF